MFHLLLFFFVFFICPCGSLRGGNGEDDQPCADGSPGEILLQPMSTEFGTHTHTDKILVVVRLNVLASSLRLRRASCAAVCVVLGLHTHTHTHT